VLELVGRGGVLAAEGLQLLLRPDQLDAVPADLLAQLQRHRLGAHLARLRGTDPGLKPAGPVYSLEYHHEHAGPLQSLPPYSHQSGKKLTGSI